MDYLKKKNSIPHFVYNNQGEHAELHKKAHYLDRNLPTMHHREQPKGPWLNLHHQKKYGYIVIVHHLMCASSCEHQTDQDSLLHRPRRSDHETNAYKNLQYQSREPRGSCSTIFPTGGTAMPPSLDSNHKIKWFITSSELISANA